MDRYEYELEVDSIIIDKGIIGFRGNGIKTISSIPSTEDDGINTVTITTDDGQEFSFTVKNGSKGDKGDKGDKGEKGEGGASKEELGLDKVDNTSDLDKPISNATQEALDTKVNKTGDIMTGDLTSQNIYPNLADTYNLGSDTKMFLNGYIKYLTVQYLKLGGKDCDIVGLHNGLYIYRRLCTY